MALHDLNRAGDPAVATLKVSDIVPKNWHRFPPAQPSAAPAYVPAYTYNGGVYGDDIDTATANVLVDDRGVGAYTPRNQAQKAALMVPAGSLAKDVGRPRGSIAPSQAYPIASDPAPAAPVVTSLSPATGAAATLPLTVTITGTGFTPYSTVFTGGSTTPDSSGKYISPTQMRVAIWAAAPGTVSVAVEDHDVLSNTDKLFTVT